MAVMFGTRLRSSSSCEVERAVAENGDIVFATDGTADGDLRGFVESGHDEDAEADGGVTTMPATTCNSSNAHTLTSSWQGERHHWSYDTSRSPSVLATSQVTAASAGIASGRSPTCDARSNGSTMSYQGTTGLPSNVTSTGCGDHDRQNAAGWGPLSGTTIGRACRWTIILGFTTEAGTTLDTGTSW